MHKYLYGVMVALLLACGEARKPTYVITNKGDTVTKTEQNALPPPKPGADGQIPSIYTGATTPDQLVSFATTLYGIKYKYASADPNSGFDCSGFITYVFNHFQIAVPRRSVDFTNVNKEVSIKDAKPGDLILFTGTDSTIREVGHMGIVTSKPGEEVKFLHATSGRQNGVTETPLNSYYIGRYVKTVRVFPQNDN
ncbi:NlpC/P60 family protein [Mucilaginibacter pallidiroseus]|uniref:NlpC/P60 family protein n=1 Tax=Mucilaginibacter pallidiroseus TaxID=2599295 RepID=A0A563U0H4_9SPHI|nr:NlpC/P60 family protein [Mucilaginibacter pallidiroseus]TWR25124.1 NlpC/P60 family protein [Mucilaginibacter pallidiroseus]